MADSVTAIQNAEKIVNDAELAALQAVLDAMTTFDASLASMLSSFPLSAKFDSSARRIATDVRSNQSYRLQTELPNLIAQKTVTAPATPPAA